MNLRPTRSCFAILLPCASAFALGAISVLADPPADRTGEDAPHHERNQAKNEKKTAIALSEVTVPDSQRPVRKATAVTTTPTTSRKAKDKDKKKAAQQAREKSSADTAALEPVPQRRGYFSDAQPDSIGSDHPHQERNADPNRHAARLFILENPY